MTLTIEAIFRSPAASAPMMPLETATLIKGIGLEGDRYAQRIGTYSVLRASKQSPGTREPGRQLTLISGEGVRRALTSSSIEWGKSIGDLRRNVVLNGISSEDLLKCIGSTMQLGDTGATVFVHRNCVPCMYNERKNKSPGLMEALWDSGGVSCEVIQGGSIAVGDDVTVETINAEGLVLDEGHQSSGFFVRPSTRTSSMVREALEGKKRTHTQLMELDSEGVERAQASYEAVGLKFWPQQRTS